MSRLPVNQPYVITTAFGVPDSNALFGKHSGIDYAGFGAGRPIYAPASGTLTNVESKTGGNMVVIFDGQYYHRLMHNSSFSRGNGHVNEGDEVAKAGTTGLSTGVHCHWDINTKGTVATSFSQFIDPNQWLKQGGDDVYEGRSAEDWAAQAKDAQQYKDQVVASLSWKKIPGQIGGGMNEQIGNIRPVIDSLEVFKNDNLNNQGEFVPYTGKPLFTKK